MKYVLDYLDWYYKRFGAECIGCDALSMNFPLICDFHDNVDGCSMSVDVDGDIWIIKYPSTGGNPLIILFGKNIDNLSWQECLESLSRRWNELPDKVQDAFKTAAEVGYERFQHLK